LPYDDLRGWIAALQRAGELKTIRTEVDPILEITEIADRVSKGSVWDRVSDPVRPTGRSAVKLSPPLPPGPYQSKSPAPWSNSGSSP
jgi:3-octaprenyl-4-hydroxybenzoate carboxy-lyase